MENQTDTKPYEDKPIALGIILKALAVLFLVAGIVHVVVWLQFNALDAHKKQVDPRVSPLQPRQQIPPGPHLEAQKPSMRGSMDEPFDPKNLLASRAEEKNMLDSYAWVDEKNGVIRIPIEVAMKKVVASQTQPSK